MGKFEAGVCDVYLFHLIDIRKRFLRTCEGHMAARGPGRCFLVGAERTPLLGDENTRRTNANAGGAKSGS